jgi:hypothetical protein
MVSAQMDIRLLEEMVMDAFYVGIAAAFFAAAWGVVKALGRLQGGVST